MGSQISRSSRSSRYPPPPIGPPLPRAASDPNFFNTSGQEEATVPDLNSYEDACREDPDLQKLDENLQLRTRRTVNSLAVELDVRSISLDSLGEVTGYLLEMNKEVVEIILRDKKDIWKDPELSELVDDYLANSLLTLDFCKSLDTCLKRAGIIESIINVALKKFEEEHHLGDGGPVKSYSRTLEELRNFRAAGDPFAEEFIKGFNSIRSRQVLMLKKTDFAMRDAESVEIAVGEIKTKVDDFVKTIHDLSERANKCSQETRMARTVGFCRTERSMSSMMVRNPDLKVG